MVSYNDGPEVTVELAIDAPVQEIWLVISDPGLPARFSTELIEASWESTSDEAPGVGSRITGRNSHPAVGEWSTTSTVIDWQPNRVFEWAVRDVKNPAATWRFELEPSRGGTILRQRYRMGPGPSGVSRWIEADPLNESQIIADRLAFQSANMRRTLESVKEQLVSRLD